MEGDQKEVDHQRRKDKKAECARRRRARMSDKERAKRNEYERKRRAKLSEEGLKKLRIQVSESKRRKRTEMNEEELRKLRIKGTEAQRRRLANMKEEDRQKLRIKDAESHRRRLAKMNEEDQKRQTIKDAEGHRKRIAKMKEDEPADRLSQWKASKAAYQRKHRQQLNNEPMKLRNEESIRRFVSRLRGFTRYKPEKYLAARKFLCEIEDLHAEIANLKKLLKQSVSDAVQNAVKVHQIKKQTPGMCQSFTFVEVQMLTEPNRIMQHRLNRDENEVDPLFHEPDRGGDASLVGCSLDKKTKGNVEFTDKIDQDDETFVLRPYDESVICEEISEINEGNKLECSICAKNFSTSLGLTIHQKQHLNHAKEVKCSVCPELFKSYNLMTTHYLQIHSSFEDGHKEVESEQIDEELERAVYHLGFLVSKKCLICFKSFAKQKGVLPKYSQHIITEHSDNKELLKYFTYICSRCEKPHTYIPHLERHWKTNCFEKWENEDGNNKQTIVCETCGIKFSNDNSLSSHIEAFHSEMKKMCEHCGKEFGSKYVLSQHIALTHGGEYKFSCQHCEKKFKTQGSLKSHIKKVHLKEKPFACQFCCKRFSDKGGLSTHLNTHTGKKPYQCKFCDKSFAANSSLVSHEGTHTGFTCKICEKSLTSYIELRGHRRQHHPTPNVADKLQVGSDEAVENERPLKPTCKVCGQTFKTYHSRNEHKRVVHDGRKYVCDVCGKICTTSSSFKYHKYTHDNRLKRFGCNLCGKQFGHATNFYQHRKVEHANQNAQIVKLTAETNCTSAEEVDKVTRGCFSRKERMSSKVKSGQVSNAVHTCIETSEGVTNPSLQFADESNDLQSDFNLDNSQGSENYSSEMEFIDHDIENENNSASLPQFEIAELRSVNAENATYLSNHVQNSCGSHQSTFEEANSGHPSVPSSLNFIDFSRANVPLGLCTLTVDEAQQAEIFNTNNVSEKTANPNENKVFIEDSEENGYLADLNVDDLVKFKTEGTLGEAYDDNQSVSSIQPYFSYEGSDDETAIEKSINGNGKSVSAPVKDTSPRLVVKLTRLLEYKCAPCDKTIFSVSRREIRHHSRTHRITSIKLNRLKKKKNTSSKKGRIIKGNFDCLYCEKKNLNSVQIIVHCSKEHPGQQPLKCKMCPKMFHNANTLTRHKAQHNNDNYAGDPNAKPFWCELCGKEFETAEDSKEHLEHWHQNKMFQCDICPYSTDRKRQLKRHKIRHSGIKPHLCDECGKAFFTPHELTDHVERVHRKIQKRKSRQKFSCNLCPYVFMKESGLKLHLKLHDPTRKHACEECGLRFIFNANLLDHKLYKHTKSGKRNIRLIPTDA